MSRSPRYLRGAHRVWHVAIYELLGPFGWGYRPLCGRMSPDKDPQLAHDLPPHHTGARVCAFCQRRVVDELLARVARSAPTP